MSDQDFERAEALWAAHWQSECDKLRAALADAVAILREYEWKDGTSVDSMDRVQAFLAKHGGVKP